MRIAYDEQTDTLTLLLLEDTSVEESEETRPGVILDYDGSGNVVSIEILDASQRVTNARRIQFDALAPR